YVTHDQVEAMTMGQRIAVLQEGRLRQLGTPAEVYERPADTFVARFLGHPGMNILEGHGTGKRERTRGGECGSLALPVALPNYDGVVQLGARPAPPARWRYASAGAGLPPVRAWTSPSSSPAGPGTGRPEPRIRSSPRTRRSTRVCECSPPAWRAIRRTWFCPTTAISPPWPCPGEEHCWISRLTCRAWASTRSATPPR